MLYVHELNITQSIKKLNTAHRALMVASDVREELPEEAAAQAPTASRRHQTKI